MNLSHWEYDTFFSDIDLIVIGSGIVGLSTAIEAKRRNPDRKIVVLERGRLPAGASTKNAGFACFGSPSELIDDLNKMSEDEVFSLVEKRWKGLLNLRSLLGDEGIGLEKNGGYEAFTENDHDLYVKCIDQLPYLNAQLKSIFGEDVYSSGDQSIEKFGFQGVEHLIFNGFEAQINTGRMALNLLTLARSEGVFVLNNFLVDRFETEPSGVMVIGEGIELTADKLVIATNGFARQLLPEIDVQPARAQVLVTSPIRDLKFKGTFHYDRGYFYFRDVGDRVLFGGGRNLDVEGETTTDLNVSELIQNELDRLLQEVILPGQEYTVDRRWSGVMGVGQKKTVIVKPIADNVVCAVRMGGMGVAIGTLIGKEAAELIDNC